MDERQPSDEGRQPPMYSTNTEAHIGPLDEARKCTQHHN